MKVPYTGIRSSTSTITSRVVSTCFTLGREARSARPNRRYGMTYKQSDTPPVLALGCEELKCDVVGISK